MFNCHTPSHGQTDPINQHCYTVLKYTPIQIKPLPTSLIRFFNFSFSMEKFQNLTEPVGNNIDLTPFSRLFNKYS